METSEKIFAAAIRLMKVKPAAALTYREIAAAAGLSHMAPYRYFKTKEEIFARIAEGGHAILAKTLRDVLEKFPVDPKRQLHEAGFAYFEFALRYPIYFRLMFMENLALKEDSSSYQTLLLAARTTYALFLTIIHNSQMTGILPAKRDAREAAFMLWTHVHGVTVLSLTLPLDRAVGAIDPKKAITRGTDAIIAGLA